MNCLKNSRSVLSLLLRRTPAVCNPPSLRPRRGYHYTFRRSPRDVKPAQRSPQQAPASRYHPPRNDENMRRTGGPAGGSSRWYKDNRVVRASAVLLAGSGAVAFSSRICDAVPFTNRTRLILLTPDAELWLGELVFDDKKEELGSKILPPDHPESVRVRRIASEIVSAVDRVVATRHRLDDAIRKDDTVAVTSGRSSPHENNRATAAARRDDVDRNDKPRGTPAANLLDKWEVIVVKRNAVNAMCLPGGKIIVYTGLLRRFREDAEVATVLGHEVAHAVARHGAEKVTTLLSLLILQLVISPFIHISYDFGFKIVRRFFVQLPFSRRMEKEADHLGLMLLAAAGYDPRVAPSVYDRLGYIGEDSALQNYMSTHPPSKERAQLVSQEHVMSEALELYREVCAGQIKGTAREKIYNSI